MRSWGFYFSAAVDELVADGEIRFDAPAPYVGAVTRLYVDNLDRDGQYIRPAILAYAGGTVVYIEGVGTFAHVRLIGAPRPRIGNLELPIVVLDATPAGLAPGPVTAAFLTAPPPPARAARDAATDPLLVAFDVAKEHLHITDTLHDADVAQKLAAASATIRDYLKGRNDPTWDDTTAPPWIQQAVLLLVAHFYEHRGDEFGAAADNDDRVWNAIANLTRRSRDPALA
jgi:hypothetical protein